jgi:hypothetical protein
MSDLCPLCAPKRTIANVSGLWAHALIRSTSFSAPEAERPEKIAAVVS